MNSSDSNPSTQDRLRSDADYAGQIRCILSDVDGVLTDGRIQFAADEGRVCYELKSFHARDGAGIQFWIRSGLGFGIITARNSKLVTRRAKELNIEHVAQGCENKSIAAARLMRAMNVTAEQVCYIGDDIADIGVMRMVGLAVAPDDAATDAREAAHWISRARGGEGVVREVIERLMRADHRWAKLINDLLADQSAAAKNDPGGD